jgi:sulfur-carrier protein
MPKVTFTCALQRFLPAPSMQVEGDTIGAALSSVFAENPMLRSYVLDDQGALRRHVVLYVKGRGPANRVKLGEPVAASDEVFVFQALTGG